MPKIIDLCSFWRSHSKTKGTFLKQKRQLWFRVRRKMIVETVMVRKEASSCKEKESDGEINKRRHSHL